LQLSTVSTSRITGGVVEKKCWEEMDYGQTKRQSPPSECKKHDGRGRRRDLKYGQRPVNHQIIWETNKGEWRASLVRYLTTQKTHITRREISYAKGDIEKELER